MQVVTVGLRRRETARRLLIEVNATLPVPSTNLEYRDLQDWVLAFAPDLDERQRAKVARAFRVDGYEMFGPARIVEHVLGLCTLVT